MLKFLQNLFCCALLFTLVLALSEARPQGAESNQDVETIEPDAEEVRSAYYDQPLQSYSSIPMDRLQMLFAQYRPNYSSYLRSPSWNGMNELFRVPESKRQVRYRQCYFNPISCFRK